MLIVDKNDLSTEKSFLITIGDGGGQKPPVLPVSVIPEQPIFCDLKHEWQMIGNSDYADYDYPQVEQYEKYHCPKGHTYRMIPVYDMCGVKGWSIDYQELEREQL